MPFAVLKNKFPYEFLNQKPPTYLSLKAFGCLCFASTSDVNRNKLDPELENSFLLVLSLE